MSATNVPKSSPHRPKARPEQEPWRTPEDAAGWRLTARGRHHPAGPKLRLTLHLDDERSAWLDREAEQAGIGYSAFLLRLIDEARAKAPSPPA